MNTVTLLGRVGVEPQKRGSDEHPVVTFSMATHNNYRYAHRHCPGQHVQPICLQNHCIRCFSYENGDWSQRTDWHRIVIFKPQLRDAVMSYLRKGQRTMVSGKITYGEITDQEGKTRLTTSIIADDVVFLQGAERN